MSKCVSDHRTQEQTVYLEFRGFDYPGFVSIDGAKVSFVTRRFFSCFRLAKTYMLISGITHLQIIR